MHYSPAAMSFTLAAIMVVVAVTVVFVKMKYFGFRPNGWTYLSWAMLAAVAGYLVVQGILRL